MKTLKDVSLAIKYSRNYEAEVLAYLDQTSDVDGCNPQGWPFICITANYMTTTTSEVVLDALIKKGSNVNALIPSNGWTALHCAIFNGLDVVKKLLSAGANVNARDNDGMTPLMLACQSSQKRVSLSTINLLLESGADINAVDEAGWDALFWTCNETKDNANIEVIPLLLKAGAQIDRRETIRNYTPLMLSALNSNDSSNIETVRLLLESGADPTLQDETGRSVLAMVTHELVCNPDNCIDPQVFVTLVRYCQKQHLMDDVNESIANLMRDKAKRFDQIQHTLFKYFMVLGTSDEEDWFNARPRSRSIKRSCGSPETEITELGSPEPQSPKLQVFTNQQS